MFINIGVFWFGILLCCRNKKNATQLQLYPCIGTIKHNTFSQGLKYAKLSFSNNHLNSSGKAVPSHLNSRGGYIRQSDYFSGGLDSANTEAALIRPMSGPALTGKFKNKNCLTMKNVKFVES